MTVTFEATLRRLRNLADELSDKADMLEQAASILVAFRDNEASEKERNLLKKMVMELI